MISGSRFQVRVGDRPPGRIGLRDQIRIRRNPSGRFDHLLNPSHPDDDGFAPLLTEDPRAALEQRSLLANLQKRPLHAAHQFPRLEGAAEEVAQQADVVEDAVEVARVQNQGANVPARQLLDDLSLNDGGANHDIGLRFLEGRNVQGHEVGNDGKDLHFRRPVAETADARQVFEEIQGAEDLG